MIGPGLARISRFRQLVEIEERQTRQLRIQIF